MEHFHDFFFHWFKSNIEEYEILKFYFVLGITHKIKSVEV